MGDPLRLLIVEDSEDDAELISLELERAGFTVHRTRVETEGAFLAALAGGGWDMIISDFQMPQFDGLRAFALYRQSGIDVPFIFVSGALGEERAVEAMRAGARDYVLKGNLARLSVAVRRELKEANNRALQRLSEEAAQREQRRLAMAVDASGVGVFEHSVPLDADSHVSERCAEILGYHPAEVPAGPAGLAWVTAQVHPADLAALQQRYGDLLAGRSQRCEVELRVRNRRGDWVDVACFAKAVETTAEGRATRVVGGVLDLSERVRLEAAFRQAQKMEAVGRLAGGVAHDFNNLLTAIFSFGTFVLEALRAEDPAYEDANQILASAEKARELTGQLLAFSRQRTIDPRVICLNDSLGELERLLRRLLGEDIEFATHLAPDLWNVHCDPGAFEQVLVNLAVNARDAMPAGGKLTVETTNAVLTDDYSPEHGLKTASGEYVVVMVSDTGAGMDEATQSRIFEPFFTTKEAGKGTGLGLATCYGIVKQAGGFIWVYSEPGEGTTFKVYLPRAAADVESRVRAREPDVLGGEELVLIAEDDEQVRRLSSRALARLGYRVLEAANGGEALLRIERASEAIDLLLTDVVMPGMSGRELVERVRSLQPGMKVLYMSGYTPNAIVHRGVLEPGAHLLEKPFTPERLARKVRQVLDDG